MKIAICDDDSAYVKKIESVVRTTLAEKNIDARFDLISDSAQLHDSAETYDMAFLDIGMPPYNGLEIAARLKKRNRNIIIFFITSYDDYIDDAMDLRVFRYISKQKLLFRIPFPNQKYSITMYIQTKSTTILQYVNFINNKPFGRMQYALN